MSEWRFADPQWVHALWAVAAASAVLLLLERRGDRALSLFLSAPMQARLVEVPSSLRRGLRIGLLIFALLASVLALMRPQWGIEFVRTRQVGAEIMIALDVSKSMLAEDVAPNRLERAKAEIRDLLPHLKGDQVGLIAFAGRASVICPLTPDFGFLRLVLDGVDPSSVSRGGTRLEEPIRKATAGFGTRGDLARVILLITDGEDHDSFPLDAARDAAQRGIHILAIGFGDEAGSEVWLSDPDTGARTRLLDGDGRPVVSRLDGELLRELAMLTEGAYVPAGTGVLDLESIFEAHIRPLMRGRGEERGRSVHKDGFQWAILMALLAVLGSALAQGGRGSMGLLLLLTLATASPEARAQTGSDATSVAELPEDAAPADPLTAEAEGVARERLVLPMDPREAFNLGLDALSAGTLDDAEELFEAARHGARGDGEVRFRATFDLAWVEVERADASLQSEPEEALSSLERAADWLRESIALRPESSDARRNLEIVLKRALLLADSIARRQPNDVETRLDSLIDAQRSTTANIRAAVEATVAYADPNSNEILRARFRGLAVQERQILADSRSLADAAGRELDALRDAADEERTPEQQMRLAQLEGVLHFVHRARERMGQARSQLRRGQPSRAHRRAATSLSNLKRAREQLQDPVELLDGLIRDTARTMDETRALIVSGIGVSISRDDDSALPAIPAWLDAAYLGEAQRQITDRSLELHAKLEAGLGGLEAASDPQQLALAEQLRAATPLVAEAADALGNAADTLDRSEVTPALDTQARGLRALIDAREHFLDLKGLIEVAWADQGRIGEALSGEGEDFEAAINEYASALGELQARNLDRVLRMAAMIAKQRGDLDGAPADGEQALSEEQISRENERLELADGLLALTESAMGGALDAFAAMETAAPVVGDARARVETATRGLDGLRRLFFSIVEHIRDAARRQVELADETEASAGREPEPRRSAFERLAHGQEELGKATEALAHALHQQSIDDPAAVLGQSPGSDPAAIDEASDKLMRASEGVLAASDAMRAASEGLRPEIAEPDEIREHQTAAVQRLAEALEILQPPQSDPSQDEQGEQEQAGAQPDRAPSEEEQAADPSQMLQAVRDQEAERHRERGQRTQQGYEPVEKDW